MTIPMQDTFTFDPEFPNKIARAQRSGKQRQVDMDEARRGLIRSSIQEEQDPESTIYSIDSVYSMDSRASRSDRKPSRKQLREEKMTPRMSELRKPAGYAEPESEIEEIYSKRFSQESGTTKRLSQKSTSRLCYRPPSSFVPNSEDKEISEAETEIVEVVPADYNGNDHRGSTARSSSARGGQRSDTFHYFKVVIDLQTGYYDISSITWRGGVGVCVDSLTKDAPRYLKQQLQKDDLLFSINDVDVLDMRMDAIEFECMEAIATSDKLVLELARRC